jgi:hypothetical protein
MQIQTSQSVVESTQMCKLSAAVQNSEVDVRAFCRGMDACDWLKTLERHKERRCMVSDADKVDMLLEKPQAVTEGKSHI